MNQSQQLRCMTKDRLDKECAMHVAQDESVRSQLTGTRTAHEMRLETILKSVRDVEHKSHEELKLETGDAISGQSKVSKDLEEHVQDMRVTLQIRLCEEREARQTT